MEQLKQIQVVLVVNNRCDILRAECRVTPIDNGFQVFGRDLIGGDVEAEDFEGKVCVGEVFPALL
jgi:hypothetical protein